MIKVFKYLLYICLFISGCTTTSSYRGGIGAYQDYDGFKDYLNRYSPNENTYYKDNTYSHKDNNVNNNTREGYRYRNSKDEVILDSSADNFNKSSTVSPPPDNIKLGDARDSEAIQRATMRPYQINGKWYYPQKVSIGESYDGIASWYGPDFHDKKTSNGEVYNMHLHTAAHKTLPMNTIVKVVSKDTNLSTIVRINDRGPFVDDRIIDLSQAAAKDIDMIKKGTARVNIEVIGFGGIISNDAFDKSEKIQNIVDTNDLKDEFKTGIVDNVLEGGTFSVQIGAFRNIQGAKHLKELNTYSEYKTTIKEDVLDGSPIYRILISGFKSEEEARDFLKSKNIDGFLIRDQ